jgi:NAD-dependent dihydropyrimidine dehydrogenase PreA subunit
MELYADRVRKCVQTCLFDNQWLVGLADVGGLLKTPQLVHFRTAVSLARRLDDTVIDGIVQHPTAAYLDLYHEVNVELERAAAAVVSTLEDTFGVTCWHPEATNADGAHDRDEDYRRTLASPLSQKLAATRAGLGWIGKTDLLVTRRFGPRVRLITVLVDASLDTYDTPVDASRCGTCRLCVEACPAQAATDTLWTAGMAREAIFDAFACQSWCRKVSAGLRSAQGYPPHDICGRCIAVCPQGGSARRADARGGRLSSGTLEESSAPEETLSVRKRAREK